MELDQEVHEHVAVAASDVFRFFVVLHGARHANRMEAAHRQHLRLRLVAHRTLWKPRVGSLLLTEDRQLRLVEVDPAVFWSTKRTSDGLDDIFFVHHHSHQAFEVFEVGV